MNSALEEAYYLHTFTIDPSRIIIWRWNVTGDAQQIDLLNERLTEIWARFRSQHSLELHPVHFRHLSRGTITFVGMNPSFSPSGITKTVRGTEFADIEPTEFFSLSQNLFKVEISDKISALSEKKYPKFFKQHNVLARFLGVNHWNHLDLFQYRETNQKNFQKKVQDSDGGLNAFGQAQFGLFMDALTLAAPKAILVANANAGHILKANVSMSFSCELGTYEIDLAGRNVPIFLSGMLTGGRALDVYSRQRLFWHIKRVFENHQFEKKGVRTS